MILSIIAWLIIILIGNAVFALFLADPFQKGGFISAYIGIFILEGVAALYGIAVYALMWAFSYLSLGYTP